MQCPKCGSELVSKGGTRVKWRALFGTAESTLAMKTKFSPIWQCESCGKYFARRLQIVEVELADA